MKSISQSCSVVWSLEVKPCRVHMLYFDDSSMHAVEQARPKEMWMLPVAALITSIAYHYPQQLVIAYVVLTHIAY